MSFWKRTFVAAGHATWARARNSFLSSGVQALVIFIVLYIIPWFGDWKSEARLGMAAILSLLAWYVLFFAWEFVRAPARAEAELFSEIFRLEDALHFRKDIAAIRQEGMDIYEEWQRAMPHPSALSFDTSEMSAVIPIEKRAERFVEQHFDPQALFHYRHGTSRNHLAGTIFTPSFHEARLERFHGIIAAYEPVAAKNILQFMSGEAQSKPLWKYPE